MNRPSVNRIAMLVPEWVPWNTIGLIAVCVFAGVVFGRLAVVHPLAGPFVIAAGLLSLAALSHHQIAIFTIAAICYLLPFGVVAVPIGSVKLTFLDVALTGALFLWMTRILVGKEVSIRVTPVGVPLLVFIGLIITSLLLSFNVSNESLRLFLKMINSLLFYFTIANTIKGERLVKQLALVIVVAAAEQAAIALLLYFIPLGTSVRALSVLSVLGYPAGAGVLRYIAGTHTLRAIGTSIDPNVLGGMLLLVLPLFASQIFSKDRLLPRPLLMLMGTIVLAALLLSYSRSAWIGAAAGVLFVATFKYRRAWLLFGFVAVVLLLLPAGSDFIDRFLSGLFFQDRAAQMRLGEYKDALRLISQYPWLGVGFGSSPQLDLYVAASSIYLLIAEQVGLVGLSAFLASVVVFLVWNIRRRQAVSTTALDSIHIGAMGGVIGALVAGIFDHYFFNLKFPHTIALFWLFVGLTMAAAEAGEEHDES